MTSRNFGSCGAISKAEFTNIQPLCSKSSNERFKIS
jgi:hypothetical protein